MKLLHFLCFISWARAMEYIIITDSTTTPDEAFSSLLLSASGGLRGSSSKPAKLTKKIRLNSRGSFKSFGLIEDLGLEDEEYLRSQPGVINIIPNVMIESAGFTSQWNLDRIDQKFGTDGLYQPSQEDGTGVDMYIMDSGVRGTHTAFGGRVQEGMSFVTDGQPGNTDCYGHGTHVASTAAGNVLGVATGASIIPVQVLDCYGRGNLFSLSAAVSWVATRIQTSGAKAVVNLSIQAIGNMAIDELMMDLYDTGAVVIVAAGNYNADACNYSPSRVPNLITVGGTQRDDTKLPISNFGPCVDVFAPGDDILGASNRDDTSTVSKYGTSFATPLVAGVVATLRQRFPSYSNGEIAQVLTGNLITKTQERVAVDTDCQGTLPNAPFLQSISTVAPPDYQSSLGSLAKGSATLSDFTYWSPKLTLQANADREICVSFSALVSRVYDSRYDATYASFRVLASTDVLATGLAGFSRAGASCKASDVAWYLLDESFRLAQVRNTQGMVIGQVLHDQAAGGVLSSTEVRDFYFIMQETSQGMSFEYGVGDGDSDRRDSLFLGLDSSTLRPIDAFKYLSFSTSQQYDIQFSNIRQCHSTASGGGTSTPTSLEVVADSVNSFFVWPSGWTKDTLSLSSCITFQADLVNVSARVMVGVANSPLLGPLATGTFTNQAADASLFELQISTLSTTLLSNGIVIGSGRHNKKVRAKMVGVVTLRVSIFKRTLVKVELVNRKKSVLLFSTVVVSPAGMGARFSLASALPQTFSQVAMCSGE